MRKRLRLFLPLLCAVWTATFAASKSPALEVTADPTALEFIGVNVSDADTTRADQALINHLNSKGHLHIVKKENEATYGGVVRKLHNWSGGPFISRVTPYVYVAATMLGANLKVLATYRSVATQKNIYNSWLVVRKADIDLLGKPKQAGKNPDEIDPLDIVNYIRNHREQARFVYHDKFSTSSYFLPALFFRENFVYSNPQRSAGLTSINTALRGESGSSLLMFLSDNTADLAAVWDGTIEKARKNFPDKFYFAKLPTNIPTDLLVCSHDVDEGVMSSIKKTLADEKEGAINIGDFERWVDFDEMNETNEARAALAGLFEAAQQRPAPVTLDVQSAGITPQLRETILQSVRLSQTEFVPYLKDFHRYVDVEWTVKSIHDEAIEIASDVRHSNLPQQKFQVSFTNDEDLTRRIGNIIHSRMHRIRYIWPFENKIPTVIRDLAFPVTKGSVFKVHRVFWSDPTKNDYSEDTETESATVDVSHYHDFQFATGGIFNKRDNGEYDFDPMSNVAYRVILVRGKDESSLFRALTWTLIGLVALIACAAIVDYRRKVGAASPQSLDYNDQYRQEAAKFHKGWEGADIGDPQLIFGDGPALEAELANLIADGMVPAFNFVRTTTGSIVLKLPFINQFFGGELGRTYALTFDPKDVTPAKRVSDFLQFVLKKQALAPFMGKPGELENLQGIAVTLLEKYCKGPVSVNGTDILINPGSEGVIRTASNHFHTVVEECGKRPSLFTGPWSLEKTSGAKLLYSQVVSPPLKTNGGSTFSTLRVVVPIPADVKVNGDLSKIWILGKLKEAFLEGNSSSTMCFEFRPIAIMASSSNA